jgi:hypothetical protein
MAPHLAADAPAEPQDAAPEEAHSATQPTEVIPAAPAPEAPAVADEPAPPTVEVPAVVVVSREPSRPQNIRYAADDVRDTPPSADYWDSEDAGEFAGLVYPARDEVDDDTDDHAAADDDTEADEPVRDNRPELDDDAPPFATAPFAPAPRLNRVRSTPTPPADEGE